jgi:hypothetical protein
MASEATMRFIAKITGLDEVSATIAAEEMGWIVRIIERDGEAFMHTEDHRTDRLNLHIKDGKVIGAEVG